MKLLSKELKSSQQELNDLKREFITLEKSVSDKIKTSEVESEKLKNIKLEIDDNHNNLKKLYDSAFSSVEWLTNKYAEFHFLIDFENIKNASITRKGSSVLHKELARENMRFRKRNMELEMMMDKIKSIKVVSSNQEKVALLSSFNEGKNLNVSEFTDRIELEKYFKILQSNYDKYVIQKKADIKSEVEELETVQKNFKLLYDDSFKTIDWLSNKYADFYFLIDSRNIVESTKTLTSSALQKKLAQENRDLKKRNLKLEMMMDKFKSIKVVSDKHKQVTLLTLLDESETGNLSEFSNRIDLEKYFQTLKSDYDQHINSEVEKIEIVQQKLKAVYDDSFSTIDWLSTKYADFYFLIDSENYVLPKIKKTANCLEAQKGFARDNKLLRKRLMELELQLNQIESLIPDVEEIVDTSTDDTLLESIEIETQDKIDFLVTKHEQENLTKAQILQRALDKYVNRRMSKSAVGKDYERYIGYLYEEKGYKVQYYGIKKGLADLGIDLICTKGNETLLIQCKNWSKSKNIHENAINQLFGTSMKYYLDKWEVNKKNFKGSLFENIGIPFNEDFQPVFITTTELSATALEFADALKINVLNIPYEKNYPRIKCNIGKDEYGLRTYIYHLPFDQKYDITQNILNGGENVLTIEEAEEKGYRKAFRWRGE